MCLDYKDVEETKKYKNQTGMITAYKVVIKDDNKIYRPVFIKSDFKFFKKGKNKAQQVSKDKTCRISDNTYKLGFHSYLTRKGTRKLQAILKDRTMGEAIRLIIIKVFIDPKDVTCVGRQDSDRVIVSKSLTIESFNSL